ncbi:MAG: T9SS type A sorting domain-containing protein [Bacteroidetes bacterium]|nr:T9SS type A sorting domain-containing protein [Bacteroidota bacterium]
MKFFLLLLSYFVLTLGLQAKSNYTPEQIRMLASISVKINSDGEVDKSVFKTGIVPDSRIIQNYNESPSTIVFMKEMSSLRNYYDLESNGTPLQIWQDPANQDNIHAVYTYSSQETGWSDRTIQYFFSSDRGLTWSLICNVPASGRAGFGTITGTSNGCALIGAHTAIGANTNVRAVFFADAFPGLGSFTALDPGASTNNRTIWPRVAATQNVSLTNKFVFCTSTSGADSAFIGIGLSLTSSNFLSYRAFNASPAECYTIARGADGRIGIAYIVDGTNDPANYGDIYFMESTDAGSNFSAPTKIFDANFSTDSLAGLRGISMAYKSNTPCVVFETIKQTTAGNFFPGAPSKIRFWTSGAPVSVVIADSNNIPYAPAGGTNDVLAPICRPSIGVTGNVLFVTTMAANSATGSTDTTNYDDIYLIRSNNSGATWSAPERITPSSPRNDWRYASISPSNDIVGNVYFANVVVQKDTVPGSNVNLANPLTNAKPYFLRLSYITGIVNISNGIPGEYKLYNNYPNPFNPSTKIRFDLAKNSTVKINIFDVNGRLVSDLVNSVLAAGTYETDFNASALSSGVYYYRIETNSFSDTKKMILVK